MPESHTGGAADVDWQITQQLLDEHGYAKIPNLLYSPRGLPLQARQGAKGAVNR
jgi:hypothetical protein